MNLNTGTIHGSLPPLAIISQSQDCWALPIYHSQQSRKVADAWGSLSPYVIEVALLAASVCNLPLKPC